MEAATDTGRDRTDTSPGSAAAVSALKSSVRCASTKNLGAIDSSEALASTLVASKYSSLPHTSPASMHLSTITSKNRRKISNP